MGTYTITSTPEQDIGIAHVAAKENMKVNDYLQKVMSAAFDSYVKQAKDTNTNTVKQKYEKAPVEVKMVVENALKDIVIAEPLPVAEDEIVLKTITK